MFAAGLKDVSVRAVRVDEYGGDAAREIGRIHVDAPAPRDVLYGSYVIFWRKRGANWLRDTGMWNFTANRPVPATEFACSKCPAPLP